MQRKQCRGLISSFLKGWQPHCGIPDLTPWSFVGLEKAGLPTGNRLLSRCFRLQVYADDLALVAGAGKCSSQDILQSVHTSHGGEWIRRGKQKEAYTEIVLVFVQEQGEGYPQQVSFKGIVISKREFHFDSILQSFLLNMLVPQTINSTGFSPAWFKSLGKW